MKFSNAIQPNVMKRGDVFAARQYSREALNELCSPVLNIDWFEMAGPTFPAHPHAGFSAVTYLFEDSPGGFRNRDSLGADLHIAPGEVHWSRAASGLVHEEIPLEAGVPVRGLQIFINLPKSAQMDAPGAYHVFRDEVKTTSRRGVYHRIAVDGTAVGKVERVLPRPVQLGELWLEAASEHIVTVTGSWGGVLIVLEGQLSVDDLPSLSDTEAIAFRADDDERIMLRTQIGARVALVQGEALDQPVFQQGPMMLADPQILTDRLAAYRRGEFGSIATD